MSTALSQYPSLGEGQPPARPPPRRTYGRKRPSTPTDEAVPSLLTTAPPAESPSKGLLNRFANSSASWKNSLAGLGSDSTEATEQSDEVEPSSDGVEARAALTDFSRLAKYDHKGKGKAVESEGEDEPVDSEALKRAMDRLRRQARGELALPTSQTKTAIPKKALEGPARKGLGTAFDSSSLTELPSDLSSPPRVHPKSSQRSSAIEEETIPVRKSGQGRTSGRRRIIMESDNDDNEDTRAQSLSPKIIPDSPVHSLSAHDTPPRRANRSSSLSGSPTPRRNATNRLPDRSIVDDSANDNDDKESIDDFFADLAKESAAAENVGARISQEKVSSAEGVGLFDDEDDVKSKPKKMRKPKPLSKADMRAMQSGIAENRRNRTIDINKPEIERMPISTWARMAGNAIKTDRPTGGNPGLTFGRVSSPNTSPAQVTPHDDIVGFTPRGPSGLKPIGDIVEDSKASIELTSSPTAHIAYTARAQTSVPKTSSGHADDDNEPEQIFDLVEADQKRLEALQERSRALAAMKAQAMRAIKNTQKASTSDDEFEIIDNSKQAGRVAVSFAPNVTVVKSEPLRRGPDAKAVLQRNIGSDTPAITKNRQQILRYAGRSSRVKDDVTETHVDFAAKAWKHGEMKQANGGTVPAGQKKGRDVVITQAQLDHAVRMKHKEQTERLRRKKEEEWGRTRSLPEKREQDIEALVAATAQQSMTKEESDEEDEDFVPDDEDDGEVEEGDDVMYYSGEETEGDDVEDNIGEDGEAVDDVEPISTEEGPKPDSIEDDEESQVVKRKVRSSNRVALDSDDEGTPRASRKPTSAKIASSPTKMANSAATIDHNLATDIDLGGDIGLGGFGDDGEGGFSQLFEATQVDDQPAEVDAFAGLREKAPLGFMQAEAMLPAINISETQAARDNALIAGEVEAANITQPYQTQPRKNYLNEQGFFTQTKPASLVEQGADTQWANMRKALAGPSDALIEISESPLERMPSSTEKDTSSAPPLTSSPTQNTQPLTRLRRRVSPDFEDSEPVVSRGNAFDRIMAASHRRDERKAAVKSNLIDAQAEESDEDGGWAPIGGGEDEDDDAEDDGYLQDLVDDQVVEEEEKKKQDELAATKLREIQQADDAKREAEARKIIEGQHRTKKRGMDFFSDDEDDEEGGKRRKWSKKERRKRRLEKEDGLDKLDGEANAFREMYEADLESDVESEDEPESLLPKDMAPIEETLHDQPGKPSWVLLRERAQKNKGKDLSRMDDELDQELSFDGTVFTESLQETPEIDDVDGYFNEAETSVPITRYHRSSRSSHTDDPLANRRLAAQRSTDSYAQFVKDESQINRRVAGAMGVSVVVKKQEGPTATRIPASGTRALPSRQSTSSSTGSVLLSRTNRFAK